MLADLGVVALDVEGLGAARAVHAASLRLDHGGSRDRERVFFRASRLEVEELAPGARELLAREVCPPR